MLRWRNSLPYGALSVSHAPLASLAYSLPYGALSVSCAPLAYSLPYRALSVSRALLASSCSSACEDHSAGEQNVAAAAVFHCDSYLLLIGILYALQTFVSYCQITVVVGVIIFACCEVKNTEWLKQKLKTMQRRC